MLKQLKIQKAIEIKRQKLKDIETKAADILKRSQDTQTALEEATTDEDLSLLETEITSIEDEKTSNEDERKTVEDEIAQLERDLEEINERSQASNKQSQKRDKGESEGMNRIQVRELLKTGEYYNRSEVKEFYEKFKNLRAVTGGELLIPEIIVNRIMDILGDYSTLYPLVDKIRINGTARVLIDTDTTPASWVEMNAALPVGDTGTIATLDFDGFKVGKVTFVDNYLISDSSIINLDEYVSRKIARAISLALDIAILNGTGAAGKQPSGIIPAIPVGNRVTVAEGDPIAEFVKPIGLIDTGLDSVGEIRAVMRRSTYYAYLLETSINVNADGEVVGRLPNLTRPDILGIPVTFNNSMAADQILYGEFDKYTLVERENIVIDSSDQVRFVEDQTSFRGKGRFDGKPTKAEAFVLVTITPAP